MLLTNYLETTRMLPLSGSGINYKSGFSELEGGGGGIIPFEGWIIHQIPGSVG